ncbi:MAG: hypothetical protein IPO60_09625 [Flavobacteriales bacterium]|nr:hypothetical protein [Flavobacteriales bacterium]
MTNLCVAQATNSIATKLMVIMPVTCQIPMFTDRTVLMQTYDVRGLLHVPDQAREACKAKRGPMPGIGAGPRF